MYLAGKKDESMVRIGCHEEVSFKSKTKLKGLKNGTLSEHLHFTSNAQSEEQADYCQKVLKEIENPVQKTSVIARSNQVIKRSDDETTDTGLEIDSVYLPELQQCIMTGSRDTGCDGCNIRFYHNGIDRDDIFDPTKDGRVSKLLMKMYFCVYQFKVL